MKPSDRAPKIRRRPPVCRSFRSSSPPSTNATTSPRCCGGWRPRSPESPGKLSSSTIIPPTAPGMWCEIWREAIPASAVSGACIEGILASSAPCAAVIDADLQHDETQLPVMLAPLQRGEADLVVGSRYVEGGSADSFNKQRAGASALATEVAKRVLRVKIADPMSGFFMIRRDRFEQLAPELSTQGFKILLDIVATARGDLRIKEVPYAFGSRLHGESKLDSMVALDFLGLVLAKLTHDVVSLRFLMFAMVGSIGLFVHLGTLFVALRLFDVPFPQAQAAGALVAMTSNFILNNFLTYRDQRLKGFAILRGLLLFYLVCSVGLFANVGVAFSVYDQEPIWWLAGAAGALMGVVWNYAMSGLFVWRKR